VKITPSGNWLSYLNNGMAADDKLYLQSAPSGSYGSIVIPELATLGNKVIHRAEIIATRIPSTLDNVFTPPARLILNRTRKGGIDSSFMFQNDLVADASGSINFHSFGGTLLADNTYRFNITRYIQGLLTNNHPNDTLRIYAPVRTTLYNANLAGTGGSVGTYISVPVNSRISSGRVVLAGGNYIDHNAQLRLHIIYSNL
jgi:hypothetical protein